MSAPAADPRRSLGRWGERLAERRLQRQGYQILARNWRCARGEIDLVARLGDQLVFIEVKTRRGRAMGAPEEGLTMRKARRLQELAEAYLLEGELDLDWRIDLIAIELDMAYKLIRYEHIPHAVLGW
ncbi:MAG: YraN family protein [Candidatus Promineifilaceae bacterium]